MILLPEKVAELEAERDWILWKMEENKKFKRTGESEFSYSQASGEYQTDRKRLTEIKILLKSVKSKKNGH